MVKLMTFWSGVAEPGGDLSPKHSSLYQILHPGSCLPLSPPIARTSRKVAQRGTGRGGFWAVHLLENVPWDSMAGRTVTQMGTGKDLDWKKEGSCCRLL